MHQCAILPLRRNTDLTKMVIQEHFLWGAPMSPDSQTTLADVGPIPSRHCRLGIGPTSDRVVLLSGIPYVFPVVTTMLLSVFFSEYPLCASTGPVPVRCCQHRTSTGPVLAHNGMFTGLGGGGILSDMIAQWTSNHAWLFRQSAVGWQVSLKNSTKGLCSNLSNNCI